ncbi:HAD family hydrolase [Pseudalkalibacillus hwajinpoensis]|uniref:HAD family hydrolase n=1 Tax=Guptibacillus hwajinpoensis TaxID=208199 RepID=UPI00325A6FB0
MIKAILYDLDGTLLNREASVESFIHDQFKRKFSERRDLEEAHYCERFIDLDNNGYTWKDKVYEQLVEEFALDISSKDLLDDYIKNFQSHCISFKGMREMLEGFQEKGYALGLISNGRTEFQLNNIRSLGIEKLFDVLLISEQEGIKKPDPVIFDRALERLNISAHEAVYVGDHPENDISGAKGAGLRTIWKKNEYGEAVGAGATVNELLEIVQVINEWTPQTTKN